MTDEVVGEQATELFKEAKVMLDKILDEKLFNAKGIFVIFPANSNEKDDIFVYDEQKNKRAKFHTLRKQLKKSAKKRVLLLK